MPALVDDRTLTGAAPDCHESGWVKTCEGMWLEGTAEPAVNWDGGGAGGDGGSDSDRPAHACTFSQHHVMYIYIQV